MGHSTIVAEHRYGTWNGYTNSTWLAPENAPLLIDLLSTGNDIWDAITGLSIVIVALPALLLWESPIPRVPTNTSRLLTVPVLPDVLPPVDTPADIPAKLAVTTELLDIPKLIPLELANDTVPVVLAVCVPAAIILTPSPAPPGLMDAVIIEPADVPNVTLLALEKARVWKAKLPLLADAA
jgi:hypothetical protein